MEECAHEEDDGWKIYRVGQTFQPINEGADASDNNCEPEDEDDSDDEDHLYMACRSRTPSPPRAQSQVYGAGSPIEPLEGDEDSDDEQEDEHIYAHEQATKSTIDLPTFDIQVEQATAQTADLLAVDMQSTIDNAFPDNEDGISYVENIEDFFLVPNHMEQKQEPQPKLITMKLPYRDENNKHITIEVEEMACAMITNLLFVDELLAKLESESRRKQHRNTCPWTRRLMANTRANLNPPTTGTPALRLTSPQGVVFLLEGNEFIFQGDGWEDHWDNREDRHWDLKAKYERRRAQFPHRVGSCPRIMDKKGPGFCRECAEEKAAAAAEERLLREWRMELRKRKEEMRGVITLSREGEECEDAVEFDDEEDYEMTEREHQELLEREEIERIWRPIAIANAKRRLAEEDNSDLVTDDDNEEEECKESIELTKADSEFCKEGKTELGKDKSESCEMEATKLNEEDHSYRRSVVMFLRYQVRGEFCEEAIEFEGDEEEQPEEQTPVSDEPEEQDQPQAAASDAPKEQHQQNSTTSDGPEEQHQPNTATGDEPEEQHQQQEAPAPPQDYTNFTVSSDTTDYYTQATNEEAIDPDASYPTITITVTPPPTDNDNNSNNPRHWQPVVIDPSRLHVTWSWRIPSGYIDIPCAEDSDEGYFSEDMDMDMDMDQEDYFGDWDK